MPDNRRPDGRVSPFAALLILVPILCCALPALIAAGAIGALGGFLANPWVIAVAVLLAGGVVVRALRRRAKSGGCPDDCSVDRTEIRGDDRLN